MVKDWSRIFILDQEGYGSVAKFWFRGEEVSETKIGPKYRKYEGQETNVREILKVLHGRSDFLDRISEADVYILPSGGGSYALVEYKIGSVDPTVEDWEQYFDRKEVKG